MNIIRTSNLFPLVFLLSCGAMQPTVNTHPPLPEVVVWDTTHKTVIHYDTTRIYTVVNDTLKAFVTPQDFGAVGDGKHDDINALEMASNYILQHPVKLIIPVGDYLTSRPWLIQNGSGFATGEISGVFSNKTGAFGLSRILCQFKAGFGIGVQLAKGFAIRNLTVLGQYTFPQNITDNNIATYKFSDWVQPGITDSRYAPYAGISIDPNENASGSHGGTSDVTIEGCSIRNWMVGVMFTANAVTANDEMVNIVDNTIESVRVAIAIGQDQSKTIKISGLEVWNSTHTVLDGVTYGQGTGGGAVFCDNWNIAGKVNQLFNMVNDRFPLSAMNIYSESIFRIGRLGGSAGANCINFELDFLTGPGRPAADYLICGGANFYGGVIRYYDQSATHRLNLVNTGSMFRDMTLSCIPIVDGLYGSPANVYAEPRYDNCHNYVSGKSVYYDADTLIKIPSPGPLIIVDRVKWIATMTHIPADLKIGDYILASPNGKYYDQGMNSSRCPTAQIGRVISIANGSATLDDVGLNVYTDTPYDGFFISRIK